MSRITDISSAVAATAMILTTLGVEASGASAQELIPNPAESSGAAQSLLPTEIDPAVVTEVAPAASLAELVGLVDQPETLSPDLQCLAGAIYFEARGEPLSGQLAVGRVIVERSLSRRFASSYCGVVHQPSQFSFMRGGRMPAINQSSRAWREARAIAVIADQDLWESPAKGALFFHAARVRPGWKLQRVAQVNTHVFYR